MFVYFSNLLTVLPGLLSGSDGKESACNAGDSGLIPGLGRSPGEGRKYSCLRNPMDRGAWWATIHGVAKSQTRLSDYCARARAHTHTHTHTHTALHIIGVD